MADIASLNLEVKSDQVKQATAALKELPAAATAAERAAKKWGTTTDAAARSTEDFSRRVQRTIKDLEFERQQLTRTSSEKQRYAILQRAGVTATSAEGQAILASVNALQAQKAAIERNKVISAGMTAQSTATAGALGAITRTLGPLVAALTAAAVAQQIWQAGMKVADLDEQAEQIGLSAQQLQAWRLAAAQNGVEVEQLDTMFIKLQRTMGSANDGNKEAINNFQKLGVNIIDANGELRSAADVMPELARGLMNVSSNTERNALMMEFLGKSGTKANTMLKDFAAGSDAAVDAAKKVGAIASAETITAWDSLADKLKVAGEVADTLMATLGAPVASAAAKELDNIATSLGRITNALNNLPKDATLWDRLNALFGGSGYRPMGMSPEQLAANQAAGKLAELKAEIARRKATGRGDTPGTRAMVAQLPAAEAAEASAENTVNRDKQIEAERWRLMNEGLPASNGAATRGKRNPTPTASGSDPYKSAIEGAKDYVAAKNAETAAIGQTVLAASRLKHETDLLNKASNDNKVLTTEQTENLKAWAGKMAEADAAFKSSSFMDDAKQRAEDFIAGQQMEQQAMFMTQQAADALRFSTEALNAAKRAGIELTPAQVEAINQSAQAMAAAKAKTEEYAQIVNLGRDVFRGFFSDMREGIMSGISFWESLGNAAINVLNRISEKLLEMAATKLFEQAFGGSSGGGGFFGGIGDWFGGLFGGGGGGGVMGDAFVNALMLAAKGRVFNNGNVVPFAKGDVFNSPTFFPLSHGRKGVMGEAGPEAIMPLRRGPNGKLGVAMHDGSGQPGNDNVTVVIQATNQFGNVVSRAEMEEQLQIVEERTRKAAIAGVLDAKSRGGAYRTGMRK